jgi:hypothetical protein
MICLDYDQFVREQGGPIRYLKKGPDGPGRDDLPVEVDGSCQPGPGLRCRAQLHHLQNNADFIEGKRTPHMIDREQQMVHHQMIPLWF